MIIDYTNPEEVEPTPLGPQGVRRVVKRVNLDDSHLCKNDAIWNLLVRETESNTALSLTRDQATWSTTNNETVELFSGVSS